MPRPSSSGRPPSLLVLTVGLGLGLVAAVGATACSKNDTQPTISDLTVPPVRDTNDTIDPGTNPTRTLPPAGTGPRSTVGNNSQATIERFDLPATLTCDLGATVSVTTTYATTQAAHVLFLIDGDQAPGTPPTDGTFDLHVACDGAAHTVVLTAVDDQGRAAVDSRAILTNVAPKGD